LNTPEEFYTVERWRSITYGVEGVGERAQQARENRHSRRPRQTTSPPTSRFYGRQGRRDGTTEEELGHDEPSEILGSEYTQRETKTTLWLVGAETLLQSCRLEFCSSNSCKTRSALWGGEIRQGNAKGLTALRRSI